MDRQNGWTCFLENQQHEHLNIVTFPYRKYLSDLSNFYIIANVLIDTAYSDRE